MIIEWYFSVSCKMSIGMSLKGIIPSLHGFMWLRKDHPDKYNAFWFSERLEGRDDHHTAIQST